MNNESVITMAAADTEVLAGAEKAGGNNKLAADKHTQQSTLSGDGNGGRNCVGDNDGNDKDYNDDDGGGGKENQQ